jgi:hypothetical protein
MANHRDPNRRGDRVQSGPVGTMNWENWETRMSQKWEMWTRCTKGKLQAPVGLKWQMRRTLVIPYWCSPGVGLAHMGSVHIELHPNSMNLVASVSLSRLWKPLIYSLRIEITFSPHTGQLFHLERTLSLPVPSFVVVITSCFQLPICRSSEMGHTCHFTSVHIRILNLMPWEWPLCILVSQGSHWSGRPSPLYATFIANHILTLITWVSMWIRST